MILDIIKNIGLLHYLILALLLFGIGFWGVVVSKNIIRVLISLEIMLNAVGINFVAFAAYSHKSGVDGLIFALFIIAVSAAQIAVAVAILIFIFRQKHTINSEKIGELKG